MLPKYSTIYSELIWKNTFKAIIRTKCVHRGEEAVIGRGTAHLVLFIYCLELKAPHNLLLVFGA